MRQSLLRHIKYVIGSFIGAIQSLNQRSIVNFLVYLTTDGLNKCIPFLSIPIIAYFLDPEEIGLMTNFNVLIQFLLPIITLGTSTYLTVNYYNLKKEEVGEFYVSQLFLMFGVFFVILIIGSFANRIINETLKMEMPWQIMAFICALLMAFINLFLSYLRVLGKSRLFGTIQISQSFILFFVTICLIYYFNWDWRSKAIGYLLSSLIISIFIICKLKQWRLIDNLVINKKVIQETINFGLPMLPHNLSFWLKSGLDKIIITQFCGLAQNGVYSVALNFGAIVSLFTVSFFNVYSPFIYKQLASIKQGIVERHKALRKQMWFVFVFSLGLAILVILIYYVVSFLIPILFNEKYMLAVKYLPFILATVYFNTLYSLFSVYIFYEKKTKLLGFVTFSLTLIQTVLTYILVQFLGVYGALLSSLIVSFLIFLFVFLISNKLYGLIGATTRK